MLTYHDACLYLPPDHVGLSIPFLAPGIPIAYAQVIVFYLCSQIMPSSFRSLHRYSFYLEWASWCQAQKTPAHFSRLSWPITFYLGAFRAFSLPRAPHIPGVFCSQYSPRVLYSSLLQHLAYFVKYCLCEAVSFILPWAPLRVWPCCTHLPVPRASSPVPPHTTDIHQTSTEWLQFLIHKDLVPKLLLSVSLHTPDPPCKEWRRQPQTTCSVPYLQEPKGVSALL